MMLWREFVGFWRTQIRERAKIHRRFHFGAQISRSAPKLIRYPRARLPSGISASPNPYRPVPLNAPDLSTPPIRVRPVPTNHIPPRLSIKTTPPNPIPHQQCYTYGLFLRDPTYGHTWRNVGGLQFLISRDEKDLLQLNDSTSSRKEIP
jgi:hypothetical protein